LMDIAMMESTVGKIAQFLEPLTEISSLRRMGQTEIREVARVILDRRGSRLSQNTSPMNDNIDISDSSEGLVPLPPEARELH
jgi:hypothetical protein